MDIVDALRFVKRISVGRSWIEENRGKLYLLGIDPKNVLAYNIKIDSECIEKETSKKIHGKLNFSGANVFWDKTIPREKASSVIIRPKEIIIIWNNNGLKAEKTIYIMPDKQPGINKKNIGKIKRMLPKPVKTTIDIKKLKKILRFINQNWKVRIEGKENICNIVFQEVFSRWDYIENDRIEIEKDTIKLICQTGDINGKISIKYTYLQKIAPLLSDPLRLAIKTEMPLYIATKTGAEFLIAPLYNF